MDEENRREIEGSLRDASGAQDAKSDCIAMLLDLGRSKSPVDTANYGPHRGAKGIWQGEMRVRLDEVQCSVIMERRGPYGRWRLYA